MSRVVAHILFKMVMAHPIILEVEIRDRTGLKLLNLPSHHNDINLIHSLECYLEEQMGGLLCMGHYYLPEIKAQYSRNRWVVQISCCCAFQMNSLEERLNEIFKESE